MQSIYAPYTLIVKAPISRAELSARTFCTLCSRAETSRSGAASFRTRRRSLRTSCRSSGSVRSATSRPTTTVDATPSQPRAVARGNSRARAVWRLETARRQSLPLPTSVCHNVHMKTISIRELHLKTGQWVRHAASRGPIAVTDRGRRVAALQPFDASMTGRPLPNREAAIRKRSKVPVDSAVYQSELREDR